jgi:hypothetical protein
MENDDATISSFKLYCPQLKCGGTRDILTCLYKCKRNTLANCKEYTRVFPELLNVEIPDQYLEKYGHPNIVTPMALRKRRKRRSPDA